jgi:hypothetical protein
MSIKNYIINVSDSFVHPSRKLKNLNGKRGNGERRLYIGNDFKLIEKFTSKPWTFEFTCYKSSIPSVKNVIIIAQNGKKDTRRFYVGVKGTSNANVKLFDEVRKNVTPQDTCFIIQEEDTCFKAYVVDISEACKLNRRHCSHSKIAIRWLEHESKKIGKYIRHAENGGEYSIMTEKGYKWPVDGVCEETKTIYEFYGDYYHGNPSKYSGDDLYHGIPYSIKWEKDKKKREAFEALGYTVVTIWESEWNLVEKSIKESDIL